MENNLYGIVIKVENIDICRSFYRDILDLGPPVLDSNFWVEFRLHNNVSLVLEKVEDGEKVAVGRGRISWLYKVGDVDAIIRRLKEYGFETIAEKGERLGFKVQVFCDPEGNPFYLYSGTEPKTDGKSPNPWESKTIRM